MCSVRFAFWFGLMLAESACAGVVSPSRPTARAAASDNNRPPGLFRVVI